MAKWQTVLVVGEKEKAVVLRRALIESGRPYECEGHNCPVVDEWLGKEIRLQVNHKNADREDNSPANLEFLCPNCHSQTATWGNNRGLMDLTSRARYYREFRKRRKAQVVK